MKKLLVIGVGAAMLFSFTPPVEAGINWGSVIKVAGDAVQSAGSSSKKQSSKQQKSGKSAQEVNATIPTALADSLDPWPPDEGPARPDWFDNRTNPWVMSNGRLIAEYESMEKWRSYAEENNISWLEPDMCRYEELLDEIRCRIRAIDRYAENVDAGWMDMAAANTQKPEYKRAVGSNIEPLRSFDLDIDSSIVLPGYHPEIN